MRYWDRQKPCRQLSFDFFVRHRFSTFDLVKPFADSRQELHLLSDSIHACVIWQTLNGFQSNFLIAHTNILQEIDGKSNNVMSSEITDIWAFSECWLAVGTSRTPTTPCRHHQSIESSSIHLWEPLQLSRRVVPSPRRWLWFPLLRWPWFSLLARVFRYPTWLPVWLNQNGRVHWNERHRRLPCSRESASSSCFVRHPARCPEMALPAALG